MKLATVSTTASNKKARKIDTSLIDKAYDYAKQMFEINNEIDKFDSYWEDNYVKFIEDFAEGKFMANKKNA